jgi:Ni/Fe-hydrogenase subunit HybB-like protein
MKTNTFRPTLFRPTAFQAWVTFLGGLILLGLVAGITIFARGLVLTNLTDQVPWGLWITIDLSAIALSAGAFMISAAVHLLKLKKYEPLARTAVFVGLIGYSMAMLTLLLDIGRPDRFWHALAFWNVHSPLWEVTMCVALYLSVLAMEVAPIFGEAGWFKSRWPRLAEKLAGVHRLAPLLAIAGLALSMLHQSSLGATYGVLKARPIWYRPGLPVLFIASAIAGGLSMTLLVSWLAARLSPAKANIKEEILDGLANFIGWVLVVYLYLRFWDTLAMSYTFEPGRSQGLQALTRGQFAFNFWVGEMLLGIVTPMVILLSSKLRRNQWLRGLAVLLVVGGLVAYRWDTNLVGLIVSTTSFPFSQEPLYAAYRPAFVEWAAGLGVISYGLLAITLGVRYLGVVDHQRERHGSEAAIHEPLPEAELHPLGVAGD